MLQKELGLPAVVAGILAGRGVTGREAALLLGPQPLDDPMALPDMEKAVARIEKAIEDGEHIAVYGDYDCDGVTATAILYSYLQSMGASVSYYIPDRLDEGFGMNMGAVDTLAKRGVKLMDSFFHVLSPLLYPVFCFISFSSARSYDLLSASAYKQLIHCSIVFCRMQVVFTIIDRRNVGLQYMCYN